MRITTGALVKGALVKATLSVALAGGLGACQSANLEPVPAVIVDPTAESREVLENAVSEALDGVQVTLAPDALTHSSHLILDRQWPISRDALQGEGRRLERPEHFQLVILGGACILVHQESGERHMLADTRCRPK